MLRLLLSMRLFWLILKRIVFTTMETKSPYFSPKKTRNFTKKQGLTLLQKLSKPDKIVESNTSGRLSGRVDKANLAASSDASQITAIKSGKGRAKNIRMDVPSGVKTSVKKEHATESRPLQPVSEKTPEKKLLDVKQQVAVKVESHDTNDSDQPETETSVGKIKIKIELNEDDTMPMSAVQKTPIKQEPIEYDSLNKREHENDTEGTVASGKEIKWEPENWRQMMENIREMRKANPAPVDTMGCDQFSQDTESMYPERIKRYHCLVSLVLSSQTKDQANHECMLRLKKHGLTPESIVATESATLEKLIYPVGFYKNKTKFLKQISQILIDQYAGDIPNNIEDLLKLPGVGKKMAHLCMRSAWNVVTGIGVDTHVHRIANWLKWVPKETKTPEETRVALEKWLPYELWDEVNHLLVGFGQTICTSRFPRCNDCQNASICPARGKQKIRSTPIKKEVKQQEDLEF
uniref:Endonuclease III homolog n=1 Tax=Anopheles farauti TaxID=69004 RepID=A0A182QTU4_9DIPT